jgi:hypothetical protein
VNQNDTSIKKAIKEAGYTMTHIASEVEVTRTALYDNINQEVPRPVFLKKLFNEFPDIQGIFNRISAENKGANEPSLKPKGIPYYDLDITAGDIPVYFDESHVRPDHYIDIFGFSNCTHSFPVAGHSMYPKICNGDIGIFQHIKDKSVIDWGSIFLIITSERRLLKYLRKSQKEGYVILASENKEFDDMEIPMDKILELFLYKGKIEKNQM